MEAKKTDKADLNQKRTTFFLLGMLISLAVVLAAFKVGSTEGEVASLGDLNEEVEQIEIPQTEQKVKPPPPPPPPVIKVVDDTEILDEEEDIIDETEVDENTAIDIPDVDPVDDVDEDQIFMVVEDDPEFPGGTAGLFKYIQKSVVYPQLARESGVAGTVHVFFVIEKDGSVSSAEIRRGIGAGCDEAALDVVNSMPKWQPGKQRGKAVRVQFTIPIKFNLR